MKQWSRTVLITALAYAMSLPANAALEKGWYMAANLGSTETDTGISNLTGTARLDESDFGGKVLMGREVNAFFAIEGFVTSLGVTRVEGSAGDTFRYQGYTVIFGSVGDAEFSSASLGLTTRLMLPWVRVSNCTARRVYSSGQSPIILITWMTKRVPVPILAVA